MLRSIKFIISAMIILCLFNITGSCSGHRYPQSLITADSLCDVNPDSAVTILQSTRKEMDKAPEKDRMYYRLLMIQANDKADRMSPESERGNITDIIGYYEHGGDKRLLPTAYYYAGRIYAELQEAPVALGY